MANMTDTDGNTKIVDQATSPAGTVCMDAMDPSVSMASGAANAMTRALGSTLGTMTSATTANRPATPRRLTNG